MFGSNAIIILNEIPEQQYCQQNCYKVPTQTWDNEHFDFALGHFTFNALNFPWEWTIISPWTGCQNTES